MRKFCCTQARTYLGQNKEQFFIFLDFLYSSPVHIQTPLRRTNGFPTTAHKTSPTTAHKLLHFSPVHILRTNAHALRRTKSRKNFQILQPSTYLTERPPKLFLWASAEPFCAPQWGTVQCAKCVTFCAPRCANWPIFPLFPKKFLEISLFQQICASGRRNRPPLRRTKPYTLRRTKNFHFWIFQSKKVLCAVVCTTKKKAFAGYPPQIL